MSWYDVNKHQAVRDISMIDLLNELSLFPAVRKAILVTLTWPAKLCTVERSFSTLKTWLRSTMSDTRLSGLCILSVHREKVKEKKDAIIEKVINKFGVEPRRLQFLFDE